MNWRGARTAPIDPLDSPRVLLCQGFLLPGKSPGYLGSPYSAFEEIGEEGLANEWLPASEAPCHKAVGLGRRFSSHSLISRCHSTDQRQGQSYGDIIDYPLK